MGKSRTSSKGHKNRYIPYNHAVETSAESEEVFGRSGRVDTVMMTQKKFSLNMESYDSFFLSTMSRGEREALELKLESELDEVRVLQKRVAALAPKYVSLSPTRDDRR